MTVREFCINKTQNGELCVFRFRSDGILLVQHGLIMKDSFQ